MTKKDYIIIAHVINNYVATCNNVDDPQTLMFLSHLCQDLAQEFTKDNPRFDEIRFYVMCGIANKDGLTNYK